MNEQLEFNCPYCGVINSADTDITGGITQTFVQDCEVCCSPIQIKISFVKEELPLVEVNREE